MFNNSKYGNLLTVILVIAIIAIIGVIGIVGYRIYKAYSTDSGAVAAANQFESTVNSENQNTTKTEISSGDDNTIGNTTIIKWNHSSITISHPRSTLV